MNVNKDDMPDTAGNSCALLHRNGEFNERK
jgi:hypothetical protein